MFLPDWSYDGADPGLRLFTLVNAKLPPRKFGDVLEIGSVDTDWLERFRACDSDRTYGAIGIDWRAKPQVGDVSRYKADALTWDGLSECSCGGGYGWAAIVSLSTIEHIGLGHYEYDPIDAYGDVKVVQRVRDALHVGGFFYFDVPYAPEGYWQLGTKCRIYDDQALRERFGPHEVLGYTTSAVDGWIDKPTVNATGQRPYYYVALLIRKDDVADF